jgi:tetratricopeptide (TPR) repeat protein
MRNSVYYSYEVHFNLGAVYFRCGDYEKALYCYNCVLQLDRDTSYAKKYVNSIRRLIRKHN